MRGIKHFHKTTTRNKFPQNAIRQHKSIKCRLFSNNPFTRPPLITQETFNNKTHFGSTCPSILCVENVLTIKQSTEREREREWVDDVELWIKRAYFLTNVYGMLLLEMVTKLLYQVLLLFFFSFSHQDCVKILPRISTRDTMSRRMNRSLLRRAIYIERLLVIPSFCHAK